MVTSNKEALNKVYNVAVGESVSINELFQIIREITGSIQQPEYIGERKGDVKNSLADISMAKKLLDYQPRFHLREGLMHTIEWFAKAYAQ